MKNIFQSITIRIALWMVIVSILPLLFIAYNLHYTQRTQVINQHLSHLRVVFKQTVETIDTHIHYQKQLLSNIASMPKIAEKLKDQKSHAPFRLDPLVESYITNVINKYGYYDLFIINPEGQIVYTFKKESDYQKNVHSPLLEHTPLTKVFDRASTMLDTAIVPLEYYSPSKRKSSFIATPIISNHQFIGVIAIQLNETMIFDLIKSYNGLGQSGEIVAGATMKDGRILSAIPLKYDSDAFKNERQLNAGENATGMIQAVQGRSGAGEVIDYRGVESVAVWGYEPNLQWGIVVKTDTAEVLSNLYQEEKRILILLTFVVIGILLTIVLSVKRITNPINNLIRSVQSFRKNGTFDLKAIDCDGEICYLSEEFNAMVDEIQSYHRDLESKITERTHELEEANKTIKNYLDIVDRFIITSTTDLKGNIIYASKAFEEISGYSKSELLGNNHRIVKDPQMPDTLFKNLWETISGGGDWHGEIRNISKNRNYYWVDVHISPNYDQHGNMISYTAVRQDITDKKRIEEISITDQLTTLFNRRYLDHILQQNADLHDRYKTPFSVVIVDIDHFKSINDTFGHQLGDKILIEFASILKNNSRSTDITGRWGGEEFLIILPNTQLEEACSVAEKMRFHIAQYSFDTIGSKTASFGVSQFALNIHETISRADKALYEAKNKGRNAVCVAH